MHTINEGNGFNIIVVGQERTGGTVANIDLSTIDDMMVYLVKAGRGRKAMAYAVNDEGEAVLSVDAGMVSKGIYGIEVTGSIDGVAVHAQQPSAFMVVDGYAQHGDMGGVIDYEVHLVMVVNAAASRRYVEEAVAAEAETRQAADKALSERIDNDLSGLQDQIDATVHITSQNLSDLQKRQAESNIIDQSSNNSGRMGCKVLKPSATFASQMTTANTIYVIKDVFDLGNSSVTIPGGCVLKFEGGCLKNGTVVGSGTAISTMFDGLFDNVDVSGTWFVKEIYSSWFKDIETRDDCIRNLFKLNNAAIKTTIYIAAGNYNISCQINAEWMLHVVSNTELIIDGTIQVLPNDFTHYYAIALRNSHNVSITGSGSLVGDKNTHTGSDGEWGMGIYVNGGCSNIHISNLVISNFWGDGIIVGGIANSDYTANNKDIHISGINISGCRRQGISITNVNGCKIENCSISNIAGTAPSAGIDIEPMDASYQEACNILIKNVKVRSCAGEGIFLTYSGEHNGIHNVTLDSCDISNGNTTNYQLLTYLAKYVRIYNCTIVGDKFLRFNKSEKVNLEGSYFEGTESDINVNFSDAQYLVRFKSCIFNVRTTNTIANRVRITDSYLYGNYTFRYSVVDNCNIYLTKPVSACFSKCYSSSILNSSIVLDYGNTEGETSTGYISEISSAKILNTTISKGSNGDWTKVLQVISNSGGETSNYVDIQLLGTDAPLIKPNFKTNFFVKGVGGAYGPASNSLPTSSLMKLNNAIGFPFFDTERKKPLFFDGTNFVNADGAKHDVKRFGTWDERPTSIPDIYSGFMYVVYSSSEIFPIFAKISGSVISWYKADGTQYTGPN